MKQKAIGIFDTGIGGINILLEIRKLLPNEKIIYYADNANLPYGNKSPEEVKKCCEKVVNFLINEGADLIVIACNSASAIAAEHLRTKYKIPFVAMEPAVKPAALHSKNGKIGVLATENTLQGELIKKTLSEHAKDLDVFLQPCHGLAEAIEENNKEKTKQILVDLLKPLKEKAVDTIVLGCTHYAWVKDGIEEEMGKKIQIIDPAPAVAKRVKELWKNPCDSKEETLFYFSGKDQSYAESLKKSCL